MKKVFLTFVLFATLLVGCQQQKTTTSLTGTWKLVKSDILPDYNESSSLSALKIFSDTHFSACIYEKKTGNLVSCNIGSYNLKDDKYTEQVITSNFPEMPNTKSDYTITIKGNRMYVEGSVRNGKAILKEVWERVQ